VLATAEWVHWAGTIRPHSAIGMRTGLLGVFRTVLVLCFRLPSLSPGNRFRPRRECDTLGLSEDEYDSYLSSIHEAMSLIALSFVGYTIRWTLSFLSVALND